MTFDDLKLFLLKKMRLSHVYQPLLIRTLIDSGGSATIRQLAVTFLANDESQLMYYEKRLKEMPIKVLGNHGVVSKQGDLVTLNVSKLSLQERAELKMICEQRLQEYIVNRGLSIWDYRLLDTDPVPDSLRYRVLKEAKGRCALCGITKDDRPLDVDHIVPRSKGGKTVYENLQVLCSKCNRSKANQDSTDFRASIEKTFDDACDFCNYNLTGEKPAENNLAFVKPDERPVTTGHSLIIPKRHTVDWFSTTRIEQEAVNELLKMRRQQLLEADPTIRGFNMGMNLGEVAGQTVFHCHFHLIPRRNGDGEKMKGGIRGVIKEKMNYVE
jgi:ATP adenylyltransferase